MQLKEAAENLRVLVVLMVNNSSIMFDYPSHWIKDAIKYSDDVVLSSAAGKRNNSVKTPFKVCVQMLPLLYLVIELVIFIF